MKRLKPVRDKEDREKPVIGHGYHKRPYQPDEVRYDQKRRKPKKRRKGLMRHLMEEAFDVIEDIFD